MKGQAIMFANEGSALDGFEDSPFSGNAGIRRKVAVLLALSVAAMFVLYIAAAPTCTVQGGYRVVQSVNGSDFCVVPNSLPGRSEKPLQCFSIEASAQAMVVEKAAHSLQTLQVCQAAINEHLSLANLRRWTASAFWH